MSADDYLFLRQNYLARERALSIQTDTLDAFKRVLAKSRGPRLQSPLAEVSLGTTWSGVSACRPGSTGRGLQGMTIYSALAAVYMDFVGITHGSVGILWWPAAAPHVVVAILLAGRSPGSSRTPTGLDHRSMLSRACSRLSWKLVLPVS